MTQTRSKSKSIILSADEVRAVLDGRKTQLRRVVKPQPSMRCFSGPAEPAFVRPQIVKGYLAIGVRVFNAGNTSPVLCPFGQPGNVLWVKESFASDRCNDHLTPKDIPKGNKIYYQFSGFTAGWHKLRPASQMPQWASRLSLRIEFVRVERLQDISEADADDEGVITIPRSPKSHGLVDGYGYPGTTPEYARKSRVNAYAALWDFRHQQDSWESNPWVWVVGFTKEETKNGDRP